MDINGQTRLTGLIGDPILYSQSPAMHNAAFAKLQLNYVYLPLPVISKNVAVAVGAIRAFGMVGVNVTVPHKEAVIPFLDQMDPSADSCGAVNTIVNRDGKLTGYNTDGDGFIDSLYEVNFNPTDKHVVILGAGGSARAVASALLDAGAATITIINRTESKALQLAAHLAAPLKVRTLPLISQTTPDVAGTALVVNTLSTSFKMNSAWLLNLCLAKGALFYDLRYGKMPSSFLDYAQELNNPALDGLGMLLHQGARAFTLFTGIQAPVDVMRNALTRTS